MESFRFLLTITIWFILFVSITESHPTKKDKQSSKEKSKTNIESKNEKVIIPQDIILRFTQNRNVSLSDAVKIYWHKKEETKSNSKQNKPFFRHHQHKTSITDVCYIQNQRKYLEDHFITLNSDGNIPGFYAIFDGHGGDFVSFVAKIFFNLNVPHYLRNETIINHYKNEDGVIGYKKFLRHIIVVFNNELREFMTDDNNINPITQKPYVGGSTCLMALITETMLYIANLGDSEAVLCNDKQFNVLTVSKLHTPILEKRLINNKRIYFDGNIFRTKGGHHSASRALGDFTDPDIYDNPYTNEYNLIKLKSKILLMASDGLWQKVKKDKAIKEIKSKFKADPKEITSKLIRLALKKKSTDNITILAILFSKGYHVDTSSVEESFTGRIDDDLDDDEAHDSD